MLQWFKKIFKNDTEPEIRKVLLTNNVWAFGFSSKNHVNQPYFHLKYKVLKEGSLKEMSIYFDKMDKLQQLTYKNWILIIKEKDI